VPTIALLSNPLSTGNRALLPAIRAFVANTPHVVHVELGDVGQVSEALRLLASANPELLVINGGDGTVQAVLTALVLDQPFGAVSPPVAVLPNGKTNLIAHDLGMSGDPVRALGRLVQKIGAGNLQLVSRSLISVDNGRSRRPVLGMFLGGAGLMNSILYCRHRIYPLGLPNGVSHVLAYLILVWDLIAGGAAGIRPAPVRITVRGREGIEGTYFALVVTTLRHLLLGIRADDLTDDRDGSGALRLLCVEHRRGPVLRTLWGIAKRSLLRQRPLGLTLARSDEIRIEGERPSVILDGELVQAAPGCALTLRHTAPQQFAALAQAA
jgi:Diacylglycerol kinase catalytic domain